MVLGSLSFEVIYNKINDSTCNILVSLVHINILVESTVARVQIPLVEKRVARNQSSHIGENGDISY